MQRNLQCTLEGVKTIIAEFHIESCYFEVARYIGDMMILGWESNTSIMAEVSKA